MTDDRNNEPWPTGPLFGMSAADYRSAVDDIREEYGAALSIGREVSLQAYRAMYGMAMADDERQSLMQLLLLRTIELFEAMMLLDSAGSRTSANIVFRSLLECSWRFCAIDNDSAFVNRYFDDEEVAIRRARRRLLESNDAAIKKVVASFVKSDKIDDESGATPPTIPTPINKWAEAAHAESQHITAYASYSCDAHSDGRSLSRYIGDDDSILYKPDSNELPRHIGLAGIVILDALCRIAARRDPQRKRPEEFTQLQARLDCLLQSNQFNLQE